MFMYFQLLNFVFCFPVVFEQLLLFLLLQAFHSFCRKKCPPPNTHQAVSTLLDNKNISEIDHFYVLSINKLSTLFSGSFCTGYGFYRLFSHLERNAHQNTFGPYVAFRATKSPGRGIFLCTSNE